ncbi:hypothetical protein vseg_007225 [Gypsophila vaccaria]
MMLRKSIKKTKNLFLKTLQNLRNFPFVSPLSCTPTMNQNTHHFDLTEPENSIAEIIIPAKDTFLEEDHRNVIMTSSSSQEVQSNPKTKPKFTTSSSLRYDHDGAYLLAQKMKDLDMMEVEDVNHVLDVEEALNYYSRLSCPAYVDIVDRFFMDMYQDFLVPKSSVNLSSSSRRLCPLKI